jgi:Flp pilus assembly pilin Flp
MSGVFARIGTTAAALAADRSGATSIEYGVVGAALALALLAALQALGPAVDALYLGIVAALGSI